MSRNQSRNFSTDGQGLVDLDRNSYNQQIPINYDQDGGGDTGQYDQQYDQQYEGQYDQQYDGQYDGQYEEQQFQPDQQYSQQQQIQPPKPQQRQTNSYEPQNVQTKEPKPYRNPYSNPQSGAPSIKQSVSNQPQYYDVKSEQPVYVPPFLKENKPLRRDKAHNVNDFLFWSVANIFLCVLLALPALFFSVQTRDNKKIGNQNKARSYSKRALIFNIFASTIGVLTILSAILLRFALYHLVVQADVNSYNVPLYQPYKPYQGHIN